MAQAVWVGGLSFGLVNIPVRLFTATSPRRVRFHQYEAGTGRRIRYRRVAEGPPQEDSAPPVPEPEAEPRSAAPRAAESNDLPEAWSERSEDAPEVAWEEIVKGYELEPGLVVTVDSEELESVAPERSRTLEIEQFVDLDDIDPVHFEKSYIVVPQSGAVAERPYWLLYRAMEKAQKVAVGRFVMRTKEYLAVVRPAEHVLMLETLFYADEVRDPKEVWLPSVREPSERELEVANQFLEAMAGEWEPARLRDEHRERLLDLIHRKSDEAFELPAAEEEAPPAPAIDLLEALRASIEAAKQARKDEERRTG